MAPIGSGHRGNESATRASCRDRFALVVLALVALGCGREAPQSVREHPEGTAWMFEGSDDERLERVARQLRGFDVAMVEVGYRYGELHWAGHDRNWDYARYQLEKIRTAIANGLERRPRRAASAGMIEAPLAAVERAIEARDTDAFERELDALTATCNACHQAEQVSFVTVARPAARVSPVRSDAAP